MRIGGGAAQVAVLRLQPHQILRQMQGREVCRSPPTTCACTMLLVRAGLDSHGNRLPGWARLHERLKVGLRVSPYTLRGKACMQ